jgi:DnaJ-class molecular chaperone
MAQEKNFYNLLGVSKDASQESIAAAFKKLAMEHHPVHLSRCPIACSLSNIAPHMP